MSILGVLISVTAEFRTLQEAALLNQGVPGRAPPE